MKPRTLKTIRIMKRLLKKGAIFYEDEKSLCYIHPPKRCWNSIHAEMPMEVI